MKTKKTKAPKPRSRAIIFAGGECFAAVMDSGDPQIYLGEPATISDLIAFAEWYRETFGA